MYSHKRRVFTLAAYALLVPYFSQAAASLPDDEQVNYNSTLLFLGGVIIVLLFVIGMLANTLRHLSFVVKGKYRKETQPLAAGARVAMLLPFLLSSFCSFGAGKWEAPQFPDQVSGIPLTDLCFIVCFIALELVVIFALTFHIHSLIRIIRNKKEPQATIKKQMRILPHLSPALQHTADGGYREATVHKHQKI